MAVFNTGMVNAGLVTTAHCGYVVGRLSLLVFTHFYSFENHVHRRHGALWLRSRVDEEMYNR